MGSFSWLYAIPPKDRHRPHNLCGGWKCLIPAVYGGGFIEDTHYRDYGIIIDKNTGKEYDLFGLVATWNYDCLPDKIYEYYNPTRPYSDFWCDQRAEYNMIHRHIENYGRTPPVTNRSSNIRSVGISINDSNNYGLTTTQLKYPLKLVPDDYEGTYEDCPMPSYDDPGQGFTDVSRIKYYHIQNENQHRIQNMIDTVKKLNEIIERIPTSNLTTYFTKFPCGEHKYIVDQLNGHDVYLKAFISIDEETGEIDISCNNHLYYNFDGRGAVDLNIQRDMVHNSLKNTINDLQAWYNDVAMRDKKRNNNWRMIK